MDHIDRHLKKPLLDALIFSPIVYVNGPRQAGKSTLVHKLSEQGFSAEYVSFDSTTQMAAAAVAPEAFLTQRKGALIIDEVQMVPDVFRALKRVVDQLRLDSKEKIVGRFLLTGSANIMALPDLSDPLVGRMSVLTLYPLSGPEVLGLDRSFIERLFAKEFRTCKSDFKAVDMMQRATFPEISDTSQSNRTLWFDGYITTILQRDVRALADIEKLSALPNLLRIMANRAGNLLNDAAIARDAGLVHVTSRNYRTLLNMLFLTFEVAPWYRNIGKRLVKSAKGYMIDTLLLTHLMDYNLESLALNRPELYGHVLENFVATEFLKDLSNSSMRAKLFHFRTSDNKEVDFVVEQPSGSLVGIEVKGADRVDASDFKGLKVLQELSKNDFVCGVVLYQGKDVVPFGNNLWAVPMSNLWE